MKQVFSRFSHWLALLIIGFSFFTMFINFKVIQLDVLAVIMGGIGLLSVGYLTFAVEKKIKNQRNDLFL
ncbi:hypothetical protein WQ54_22940 [Bacillus sp. SA1-12]|uniref:hypothetical protein n=1 Tax=Bacillus sp. SA1-12 TaxID=1455638 RepID=UPI000626FAB1|nr:hypothetical protein [Bacillus sp. SA1-12]KKI89992.1 hypothetical protein WQ54_22940 [Bacillus sp. SA1-12]